MLARRWGQAVLLAAMLGFAASMATSFDNLRKYEDIGLIELSDSTWIVAQTKIDFHRLLEVLTLYVYGDEATDHEDVLRRLDSFYSRLPLYLNGSEGERFSRITGLWPTIQRTIATLDEVDTAIRELERGDVESLRAIRARLDVLDRPLMQIITNMFVNNEGAAVFRNEALERSRIELLVAFFGSVCTGGVLILLLLGESRASRRAEDRAEVARTRLVEAIESISEGFVLSDADDRILLFNRRFREMHGAVGTLLRVGTDIKDFLRMLGMAGLPADAKGRPEAWSEEQVARRRDPNGPFVQQFADGRWLRVSDRRTADGGIVGIRTDITELMQREIALEAARNDAEAASRAKTQFLATVSHELRTPLNAIIGFSELMSMQRMGPLGSQQYLGYAKAIHDSGQHLLAIISDILDIARIESGRLELDEEVVDLSSVVDAALRLVQERATAKRIALRHAVDGDVPRLKADHRLLKQALINLLTNAIKFTPEAGSIALRVRVAADGEVRLSVTDTGIGIAEADLARVVQPFVQLENHMTRRHEGTGLGLPLVAAIAELHGGKLKLQSKLGEGTTAIVTLPGSRRVEDVDETRGVVA